MRRDHSTPIRTRPVPAGQALPTGLHPVLHRVLAARRVVAAELNPELRQLIPVSALPGVEAAAARLVLARERQERLLVVGDFDADGATATAVMLGCLVAFGFARAGYLVPDRFRLGYGLSVGVVELAARREPSLLVTVDNGITSLAGVERAGELGMDVIVTDHHLAAGTLPATPWIVNPNLPGSPFPSRALAGVGVAFYVMAALGRQLEAAGLLPAGTAGPAVASALDLVAVGTVADLVPLDFNNRILVSEGLRRIRAGRVRPGIRALFAVAGRDEALAREKDLGFAIAPRLNAAGRLADMGLGVECLLAPTAAQALPLAEQLEALNRERREIQDRMEEEAGELLGRLDAGADEALCLFDEGWHPGVVGLVASRIRERSGRPAIAFARAAEAGLLRGSARSVDGIHVRDAIALAVASLPEVPVVFGGHAMAAGITLPEPALPAFTAAFAAALAEQGRDLDPRDVLWTDGSLAPADLTLGLAEVLASAGPWGQAFPEPLFDNELLVLDQRVVGERHLKLKVRHPGGGAPVDAIAFGRAPLPAGAGTARCLYRLDVNVFRDVRSAQLVVEHLECD